MLLLDTAPAATLVAPVEQDAAAGSRRRRGAARRALAGVSYVHFRETPPAAEVVRFQMALPDNVNFTQFGVSAISPDGRKVAFTAYGDDSTPRVWIRSLDSPTAQPLVEARIGQTTAALFWSPDSQFIAYGGSKQLSKVDIAGGSPQALADISPAIGGAWTTDGTILVGSARGILKLSANGGEPTLVTKPESPQEAHGHPVLLPDGRHFLYLRGQQIGKRTINLGDLNAAADAQPATPILTNDYGTQVTQASDGRTLVLFMRDGTLLAQEFDMKALALTGSPFTVMEQVASVVNAAMGHFSVSNTGTFVYRSITGNQRQLTWFNRQGEIVGRPGEPAPYGTMKVSPDGSKAVVVQRDPRQPQNSDLWIVDLASGASRRLTFDPGPTVSRCGHLMDATSRGSRLATMSRTSTARPLMDRAWTRRWAHQPMPRT